MISRLLSALLPEPRPPSSRQPITRIFLDVSTIIHGDARTGIQRVVRAICEQLSVGDHGVQIFAVAASKRSAFRIVNTPYLPEVPCDEGAGGPLALRDGDAFVGLDLSAHLLFRHRRQLRRWRRAGAVVGIVVYDLLPYRRPDWFNARTSKVFRRWLSVIGNQADLVLPISQTVGADLRGYLERAFPRRARHIRSEVLRLGGSIKGTMSSCGMPQNAVEIIDALRSRSTVLMVGTIEPRKGHAVALAAHHQLWSRSPAYAPYLVIVGKPGWKTETLQESLSALSLESHGALWLPMVSDEFLDMLYRECAMVLVASFDEGYCLPVHEALAHGKAVLARDLPVLREFDSPLMRFFSDDSATSLGKEILAQSKSHKAASQSSEDDGWERAAMTLVTAVLRLRQSMSHAGETSDRPVI